jgi:putative SOS response-associated peptidase YedK
MCGRFAFFSPAEAIVATFGVSPPDIFAPRYNIAPTQSVMTLVAGPDASLVWREQQWGLVPFWAKDPAIGNRMINARAETVTEKPSYRQPFSRHRCLVPASGFYEWRKDEDGKKTPYYISRTDGQPLAMAGIWDSWDKGMSLPQDGPLRTFSILTTGANAFMQALHHRMPVILEPAEFADWLNPATDKNRLAQRVMEPVQAELQAWAVSREVNSPLNDQSGLVAPV